MANSAERARAHANLGGVDEAIRRSLTLGERAHVHEALGGVHAALCVSEGKSPSGPRRGTIDAGLPNRPDLMPLARVAAASARAARYAIGRLTDFSRRQLRQHTPLTSSGHLRVVSLPADQQKPSPPPPPRPQQQRQQDGRDGSAFVDNDVSGGAEYAAAVAGAAVRRCLGPLDALRLRAIDATLLRACRRASGTAAATSAEPRRAARARRGVSMREEGACSEWIVIDAAVECRQSALVDPSELTRAALGLLTASDQGASAVIGGGAQRHLPGGGAAGAGSAPNPAASAPPADLLDDACMARARAQFAIDLPRLRMFVNDEPLPSEAAPAAVSERLRALLGEALGDEVLALSTQGALAPLLCWACEHYAEVERDVHVVDGGCEEVRVLYTVGDGGGAPTVELVLMKPFRVIQLVDSDATPVTELLTVTHLMLSPWRGGNATISVPVAPTDVDWGLASSEDLAQTAQAQAQARAQAQGQVQQAAAASTFVLPAREKEVLHAALSADATAGDTPLPHMYGSWQLVDLEDDFAALGGAEGQQKPGEAAAMVSVEA